MSSEIAVRLRGVSKSYTVYAKPRHWLMDFMGLRRLLKEGKDFRSFWALRDIDLEILKGRKVAFVGRNGAGKSTLLRIISENVAATGGTVEVHGRCEALMQLGTGFNPEFSGRECVISALAYLGITGRQAEDRLWDIVEFSELDEFIEQPVKTYSSGMYLRLAFSVATAMAPEILIIDEILGAGDLYFQAKCLARMQELTSGPGTTVLFVSHDLESAQRLCDTFVWIDRGRVVAQGPSADVRAAYEDSVRKQQELRLRARNLRLSRRTLSALEAPGAEGFHLLGQFTVEPQETMPIGPHIHAIQLHVRGQQVERISVGDAMDDNSSHYPSFVVSDRDGGWSEPQRREGRLSRAVLPGRGDGRGAAFALFLHYDDLTDPDYRLELEVVYQDSCLAPCHVELNAPVAGMKPVLALEHSADQGWKVARGVVPRWIYAPPGSDEAAVPVQSEIAVRGDRRYGTGQVVIDRVRFLDGGGKEAFIFQTGRPMSVVVAYRTQDPSLHGSAMLWAVGFERSDGVMAATMISTVQEQFFAVEPSARLRLTLDPLLLTRGTYRVSVVLFSRLDLHGFSPHFTRSPDVYDMHRLAYEVVVEGSYPMEIGLVRHPARWDSLESGGEA